MGENARRPSVRQTPLHRCIALCSGARATCGRCWFSCIWRRTSDKRGVRRFQKHTLLEARSGYTALWRCFQGRCLRRAWLRKEDEDVSRIRGRSVQKERPSQASKAKAEAGQQQRKAAGKEERQARCVQPKVRACIPQKGRIWLHCAATALPLCCTLASAHPPPLSAAFGPPLRDGTLLSRFWQRRVAISDRRSPAPATIRSSIAQPHHRHSLHAPRQHPSSCSSPGDAVTHTLFRSQPPRRASLHSFRTDTLSIPASRRVHKLVTMARDRLAAMRVSLGRQQHRTSHAVMTDPHSLLSRPNKRVVTAVTAAVTTATETTPTRHPSSSSNRLRVPTTSRPTPTASHRPPTPSPSKDTHHPSRATLPPSRPDTDRCPRRSQQATLPPLLPEPTRTRCRTS